MTSNVFNMFTQPQIAEFKEAFKMIDQGKKYFFNFFAFVFYFIFDFSDFSLWVNRFESVFRLTVTFSWIEPSLRLKTFYNL